ncbi:MAG: Gfo/Idh/MocA family oxidoreductase [Chitinophagaceae bacterium]|jgi:predicted dehydrogenase|nr:Gfo/Idh/MocA family oxidoreductase [Chitinophagaceae bacterium]
MNPPLRFALIGCGRIGQRHADIMASMGALVAVCDIDEEKCRQLAKRHAALPFACADRLWQELQGNIDVAVICTPNGLHAAQSIAALRAGCHVLCEKPMALTMADAREMMTVARKAARHLWVVKQNRFNPPVQAVKQLLQEGRLGQIYSVQLNGFWNRPADYYEKSWKGTLELDGGTLFTQFSHFIDLLVWFFGPFVPEHACLQNLGHTQSMEFEDTGIVTGRFESGALLGIHYTVNAYRHNMEGSIAIFGEKGTIKIGGQYLNELDYQSLEGEPVSGLPAGNPPNQYGSYTGSMSNHPEVYRNLLMVLAGNGQMINSIEEAAATVEAIERIYSLAGRSPAPTLQRPEVVSH